MKTEEIKDLFAQFESIVCDYNGVECWSARELYKLLGYVQWRNFLAIVDKAKTACENAGILTSSLVRYFYLPHDGTYGFKGVSEDLTGDAG